MTARLNQGADNSICARLRTRKMILLKLKYSKILEATYGLRDRTFGTMYLNLWWKCMSEYIRACSPVN
jgi:hypothetical protein